MVPRLRADWIVPMVHTTSAVLLESKSGMKGVASSTLVVDGVLRIHVCPLFFHLLSSASSRMGRPGHSKLGRLHNWGAAYPGRAVTSAKC